LVPIEQLTGSRQEDFYVVVLSNQDGCRSAVALLLKAALIQVSDYRLLGASGL
jgi:histidinol phosphatase-like enzyme